jgi:hypothetical protein
MLLRQVQMMLLMLLRMQVRAPHCFVACVLRVPQHVEQQQRRRRRRLRVQQKRTPRRMPLPHSRPMLQSSRRRGDPWWHVKIFSTPVH